MRFPDSEPAKTEAAATATPRYARTMTPHILGLLVALQPGCLPAARAQEQTQTQAQSQTQPTDKARASTASPPNNLASTQFGTQITGQITGQVQDPTGAIIPGATIHLQRPDATVIATTLSDTAGRFRIPQPPPGQYRLAIALPGFKPLLRPLLIGSAPLTLIALTMDLAGVSTVIDVNAAEDADVIAPDRNGNAATVSADDIRKLPIFDGDVVSTLSAFLDAGIAGEGGPTLVIDGVERSALRIAPSAIDQVIVNQDPYSARYTTPGRGQIEIVTKTTADRFHGAFNFTFRDSALDATNAFATNKPPEQRRIYEGYLTGPIKPLRNTAFLLSLNRQESDSYAQVNAAVIPTLLAAHNLAAPSRNTNLTLKISHRFSDRHSAYVLYELQNSTRTNQNVGGLVQDSAGVVAHNRDQDIVYHDDLILSPNKLNQFSFLFEDNLDTVTSSRQAPAVIVAGLATFGGAQNDILQSEFNPNISDIFSWTRKTHQLKFGIQLPNAGRRILEDRTNRLGTYTFASLAAFQQNTPNSFSIQQGQTRFLTHFVQPQAFAQDQLQLTPKLTVTAGLRYFWQNALPGTMDGLQPRLSFAYLLDKKHAMVLRVGSGIYFRRVGVNIGQQLARYEHAAERSLLLTTNLCYPDITACNPLAAQPPSLFNFQPNLKSPVQGYYGLSIERQIAKRATLTLSYSGYRGWHALRSIDVNAPLPPFTTAQRPNPSYAQVLQLNSGGYQKSDFLAVNLRGRLGNAYAGNLQYGWQHAGSNTEFSTFMPQNQYDPNAEWSRTDTDQRQRLSMFGTFFPDRLFNLGIGFYHYTPLPYTVTTGTDDYRTGIPNLARPAGIPRNSLNAASYQDLQVRWGYTFKLRPTLKDLSPTLGLSLSSFNTLNRVNYQSFVGVRSSPNFMHPTEAASPRRLQLTVSYTF